MSDPEGAAVRAQDSVLGVCSCKAKRWDSAGPVQIAFVLLVSQ